MTDLKDRFGNFGRESIGHQQWPADILAEEFQPTKDVDVPPDNTEIETIAGANIAVGGNAVVQSDIDGNILPNLRWCALECRQCCLRCSQGQLTGWRWIVARNRRDRSGAVLTIRMPVVPEIEPARPAMMAHG